MQPQRLQSGMPIVVIRKVWIQSDLRSETEDRVVELSLSNRITLGYPAIRP